MNPEKLNPQIKEFQIGKKDLRKVTIYPLSYFDEKQLISVIVNAYIEFIKRAEKSKKNVKGNTSVDEENIAFATYVLDLIEKNILEILQLVLCVDVKDAEVVLKDATNLQLSEIVCSIYDTNFGGDLEKNVQRLLLGIKKLSPMKRP